MVQTSLLLSLFIVFASIQESFGEKMCMCDCPCSTTPKTTTTTRKPVTSTKTTKLTTVTVPPVETTKPKDVTGTTVRTTQLTDATSTAEKISIPTTESVTVPPNVSPKNCNLEAVADLSKKISVQHACNLDNTCAKIPLFNLTIRKSTDIKGNFEYFFENNADELLVLQYKTITVDFQDMFIVEQIMKEKDHGNITDAGNFTLNNVRLTYSYKNGKVYGMENCAKIGSVSMFIDGFSYALIEERKERFEEAFKVSIGKRLCECLPKVTTVPKQKMKFFEEDIVVPVGRGMQINYEHVNRTVTGKLLHIWVRGYPFYINETMEPSPPIYYNKTECNNKKEMTMSIHQSMFQDLLKKACDRKILNFTNTDFNENALKSMQAWHWLKSLIKSESEGSGKYNYTVNPTEKPKLKCQASNQCILTAALEAKLYACYQPECHIMDASLTLTAELKVKADSLNLNGTEYLRLYATITDFRSTLHSYHWNRNAHKEAGRKKREPENLIEEVHAEILKAILAEKLEVGILIPSPAINMKLAPRGVRVTDNFFCVPGDFSINN